MIMCMIPNIFYEELSDGLELFAGCLGFRILYQDDKFAVVSRDNSKVFLVVDSKFDGQVRAPVTLETNTIEADYAEIREKNPSFLDPAFKTIKSAPWGGREFALLDAAGNSIMIRQFDL